MYDFMKFLPYFNKSICVAYGALSLTFEYTAALLSFFEFTTVIKSDNLFFTWISIFPLCFGLAMIFWNY